MLYKAYYHCSKYASSQISWTLFWYLLRRERQSSSDCICETKDFVVESRRPCAFELHVYSSYQCTWVPLGPPFKFSSSIELCVCLMLLENVVAWTLCLCRLFFLGLVIFSINFIFVSCLENKA